jgi:hypothetical protein
MNRLTQKEKQRRDVWNCGKHKVQVFRARIEGKKGRIAGATALSIYAGGRKKRNSQCSTAGKKFAILKKKRRMRVVKPSEKEGCRKYREDSGTNASEAGNREGKKYRCRVLTRSPLPVPQHI